MLSLSVISFDKWYCPFPEKFFQWKRAQHKNKQFNNSNHVWKSSISFPLRPEWQPQCASWKSYYVGICIESICPDSVWGFTFHPRRTNPNLPPSEEREEANPFSQLFSDIMRLAYELERLTQFDRIAPCSRVRVRVLGGCMWASVIIISFNFARSNEANRLALWTFSPGPGFHAIAGHNPSFDRIEWLWYFH